MYTPLHRMTIVTALTFALLASVMSGAAVARPIDQRTESPTSSLAGTTESQDPRNTAAAQHPDSRMPVGASSRAAVTSSPNKDLPSPDVSDAMRQSKIQLALERYYSTYGEPKPLPVVEAPAPAPVDDPEPWLPIAVAVAAMLAIVAASVTVARRHRVTA